MAIIPFPLSRGETASQSAMPLQTHRFAGENPPIVIEWRKPGGPVPGIEVAPTIHQWRVFHWPQLF